MKLSKLMTMGLLSAAAAQGCEMASSDMQRVVRTLDAHHIYCNCVVCTAFVSATSAAEGFLAAAAALDASEKNQQIHAP
jgi:hypothetical protein